MPDGAPAAPGQQPQAPFGATSAVAPTPNRGHEAAGLQRLGVAIEQLQSALTMFGVGSDPGKAVLDCLQKLSKFAPAGSQTAAGQRNATQDMMMRQAQQNQQIQQMKAMQQQGGQGAQPGASPMQPKAA